MLVEINRMIVWVERYGLRKDEIAQMLHNVVGEDVSIPQSEAAEQLGNSLRRVEPDPSARARLLCGMMYVDPEDELEPEEVTERMQLLPVLLQAVREIVESCDSAAKAAKAIDAIL